MHSSCHLESTGVGWPINWNNINNHNPWHTKIIELCEWVVWVIKASDETYLQSKFANHCCALVEASKIEWFWSASELSEGVFKLQWLFCCFRDSKKFYGMLLLSSIYADNEGVDGFELCIDLSAIDIALSSEVFYSL